MSDRLIFTVKMQVTIPQALALKAFFEHWNKLASWGCSRMIAFYVDGDGDFRPKCEYSTDVEIPELTPELAKAAMLNPEALEKGGNGELQFDYDSIAWKLRNDRAK